MSYTYHLVVAVVSLSIGIFDFSIFSQGGSHNCFSQETMSQQKYDDYLVSLAGAPLPGVTISVVNGLKEYYVPVQGTNIYSYLAIAVAAVYAVILLLNLILTLVVLWLSDMVPDDFMNIGSIKRFTAVTTKIFPPFVVIVHWIAGVLIFVFWVVILMGSCTVSTPAEPVFGFNNFKYHSDCVTLNIVNSIVFILLHYIAAIWKDMIYVEPFMYAPSIGEANFVSDLMLKKLGP